MFSSSRRRDRGPENTKSSEVGSDADVGVGRGLSIAGEICMCRGYCMLGSGREVLSRRAKSMRDFGLFHTLLPDN